MKKQITVLLAAWCTVALIMISASAGECQGCKEGKITGKVFFNYNHDFSQERGPGSGQTNGFTFTRIYFGYEQDLDDRFSVRFLIDADTTKDSNGKYAFRPFVKNAYLSMKCKLLPEARWSFGMIGMPFVGVPESSWEYRCLYQMAMDKQLWGSTADLGVGWKGMWKKMLQVEFALVNGAGYKNPEADMFKLIEVRPAVYLLDKALVASVFFSYEAMAVDNKSQLAAGYAPTSVITKNTSATILSVMAGYNHKWFRVGGEYSLRHQADTFYSSVDSSKTDKLASNILSVWAHVRVHEKITLLARYDQYEPNTDAAKDKSTALIAGVDFHPIKNVRLIPNVQLMGFEADDNTLTANVNESKPVNTALLTFEYSW